VSAERDGRKRAYYFGVVDAVRGLATCDRGQSGAVIVRRGQIIATGYVGSPAGAPHCDDDGHVLETRFPQAWEPSHAEFALGDLPGRSVHCVRTVHAEMNAILQCARFGPSCDDAEMYCTMFPCYECAKVIVNAGVTVVHAYKDYHRSSSSKSLFDASDVRWDIEIPGEVIGRDGYANQTDPGEV